MLSLRPIEANDREWIFELANDPDVRRWSLNSNPIPWDDHVGWFARRLVDPISMVLVLQSEGERVGWVRFDVRETIGYIGIALAKAARGRGFSVPGMSLGLDHYFAKNPTHEVRAQVRVGNEPTNAMLRSVGFEEVPSDTEGQSEWRISASSWAQASG